MGEVKWEGYDLDYALASVGEGWADLVRRAFAAKPQDVNIEQVKEKFGGLRIYCSPASESYLAFLRELEAESAHICERCGKPGTQDNYKYWIKTLCDEHKQERQN